MTHFHRGDTLVHTTVAFLTSICRRLHCPWLESSNSVNKSHWLHSTTPPLRSFYKTFGRCLKPASSHSKYLRVGVLKDHWSPELCSSPRTRITFPLLHTPHRLVSSPHTSLLSTQMKCLLWVGRLREPTWFPTQLSLGGEMGSILPEPF